MTKAIALVSAAAVTMAVAGCVNTSSDSNSALRSPGPTTVDKVAVWRIDDVPGDSGCSLAVLKKLISAFQDSNGKVTTPIVLGIIGRTLDPNWNGRTWQGQPSPAKNMDPADMAEYATYVKQLVADNPDTVEIANHTYEHPTNTQGQGITVMPAAAQLADLQHAQQVIKDQLGLTPTTLVLPQNSFNTDSVAAMKAVGLNTLGAECTWVESAPDAQWPWHNPSSCTDQNGNPTTDPSVPVVYPNLVRDGITYVPAGATIEGDAGFSNYWAPADIDKAEAEQQIQMKYQNLAANMLHVQEFAPEGECTSDDFSDAKVAVIKQLIAQNAADGWTPRTMRDLAGS